MEAPRRRTRTDEIEGNSLQKVPFPRLQRLLNRPEWVVEVLDYLLLLHLHTGPDEFTHITKGGNTRGFFINIHLLKNDQRYLKSISEKLVFLGPGSLILVVNSLISRS